MILRFVLLPALFIGFATASMWSMRLAWADFWFRQQTLAGTQKAIALAPANAEYSLRLSMLEAGANSAISTQALERSVALNPAESRSWTELGLRHERAGDRSSAERCLLRAAEEDRQYLPRWTLANYYFRANQTDRFWFWAGQAAKMVHGDATPLFRLCGRVAENGELIERLDIRRAEIQLAYLSYLLGENRLDLIPFASRRLLDAVSPASTPVLLNACDRLLDANCDEGALTIWNMLADAKMIPFVRLEPARDPLTNGDFRRPPTSRGFDWHMPAVEGITASTEEGGGLRLTFSGTQPEQCEPLFQLVPVQKELAYNLEFEYRTYGLSTGSGVGLRITDNIRRPLAELDILPAEEWRTGRVAFSAPSNSQLARLALAYHRPPGATRIDGFVVLRRIEMKPTQGGISRNN